MNMLFRAIENRAGNEHEIIFLQNFSSKHLVRIKTRRTFAPANEKRGYLIAKIFERFTYITPVVQDEEETVDTRCNETDLGLKRLRNNL